MKLRYLLVFVACCLAVSMLYASEVGNNPEQNGFRFDFGFDRSSREVKLDKKAFIYSETYDYGGGYYDIATTWIAKADGEETLDKLFVKFSWGFADKYAFYFKGGMARMKGELYNSLEYDRYEEYVPTDTLYYWHEDYEQLAPIKGVGDWSPFYGAGFKAVFFESGDFKVGMDLQYNLFDLDSSSFLYRYSEADTYNAYRYYEDYSIDKTKTTEYQLALIVSKKGEFVSPYGGFKLSGYNTDYKGKYHANASSLDGEVYYDYTYPYKFSTKQQDVYGFFFGVDCKLTKMMMLNAELRVGDETAMTTLLSWQF